MVCVCMYMCVKKRSWTKEKTKTSGAEIRWLIEAAEEELQSNAVPWEKRRERPRRGQSCNQIPLGMGETIMKPWENGTAAPKEPPRKTPLRDKAAHSQAATASPDSARCADLEAGPHPSGRKKRK